MPVPNSTGTWLMHSSSTRPRFCDSAPRALNVAAVVEMLGWDPSRVFVIVEVHEQRPRRRADARWCRPLPERRVAELGLHPV